LNTIEKPKRQFFSLKEDLYPYLLVNFRSGASFTRVDSKDNWSRIAGTSIGSSFFWGVLRLLDLYNDPTKAVYEAG
jgi:type II pantothenate kinase